MSCQVFSKLPEGKDSQAWEQPPANRRSPVDEPFWTSLLALTADPELGPAAKVPVISAARQVVSLPDISNALCTLFADPRALLPAAGVFSELAWQMSDQGFLRRVAEQLESMQVTRHQPGSVAALPCMTIQLDGSTFCAIVHPPPGACTCHFDEAIGRNPACKRAQTRRRTGCGEAGDTAEGADSPGGGLGSSGGGGDRAGLGARRPGGAHQPLRAQEAGFGAGHCRAAHSLPGGGNLRVQSAEGDPEDLIGHRLRACQNAALCLSFIQLMKGSLNSAKFAPGIAIPPCMTLCCCLLQDCLPVNMHWAGNCLDEPG